MQRTSPAGTRVTLQGKWTMHEAADRLASLAGELEGQLCAVPRPAAIDIDLAGITGIDACGCQLLALFLENLKRHGILPRPVRIPEQLSDSISLLGFAAPLAIDGAADEETP